MLSLFFIFSEKAKNQTCEKNSILLKKIKEVKKIFMFSLLLKGGTIPNGTTKN
jgi:hypothetical protein